MWEERKKYESNIPLSVWSVAGSIVFLWVGILSGNIFADYSVSGDFTESGRLSVCTTGEAISDDAAKKFRA